ncbi:MAG: LysR family transcriptional regulator [Candidatus Cloacimonetes bacterium]|nr:LysR family transcriptional regulator [Candidatus Cloacimonadota bacterium]MCK9515588.1 LysR family transcriptional regulator [Ottowia sp.]
MSKQPTEGAVVARTRTKRPVTRIGAADLKLIQVFRAVVENGGFAAAAAALRITASTVSIHMGNLETRLGLTLCQRGRAGFALTEEGKEVYEASLHLLASMEAFRTQINSLHAVLRGELNIGITDNLVTIPQMYVSNALSAIKRRGPEIHISIHMGPAGEVERSVINGHFQVGVVPLIKKIRALEYVSLYDETVYLYCAADHPLYERANQTFRESALKTYDAVQPLYPLPPSRRKLQRALNETASARDREGVAFLILTGSYIGYLPEHFAARWVQSGQLRALNPQALFCRIPYAVITRRGRLPNRVLEEFLLEIKKQDAP